MFRFFNKIISLILLIALSICILLAYSGCSLYEASSAFFDDVYEDVIIPTETFPVSDSVTDINIEIGACSLEILKGKEFRVESNYKYFSFEERNNQITICETKKFIRNNSSEISIKVWIPEGTLFKTADITTGAGQVCISYLNVEDLNVSLGAGNVEFDSVSVTGNANIKGGVGRLLVENSSMNNFKFEMGVGAFEFNGSMLGSSKIDCGVGKTSINLRGTESDYTIKVETGLGKCSINAEKNGDVYGHGDSIIVINGGVGEIVVDFYE